MSRRFDERVQWGRADISVRNESSDTSPDVYIVSPSIYELLLFFFIADLRIPSIISSRYTTECNDKL